MKNQFFALSVVFLFCAAIPASAATILFNIEGKAGVGLLAGNENVAVTGTPGTGGEIGGGISYDNVTNILSISVAWGSLNGFTDLTGAASASHIHGPTTGSGSDSFTQNAGVLFNLPRANSTANAGSIATTVALSESQEAELLAGRYYINIHTATNSGGEIRGNIVIPEPSLSLLLGAGLFFLARRRR